MEIEIELPAEDAVAHHCLCPARFVGFGADILFAEDVKRLETEPFAQIRLRRESVGGAVIAGEFHVTERLGVVSDPVMGGGLEVINKLEGALFGVVVDDAPLGVVHLDEVFPRGSGFVCFEGIDDMLRQGAELVTVGRPVEDDRLCAGGEAVVVAIDHASMGVDAPTGHVVNAAAAVPLAPRRCLGPVGEGSFFVAGWFRNGRVTSGLAQERAPAQRIHFLMSQFVERLGRAGFVEAGAQVGPGHVGGAAETDDIAEIRRVEGEGGLHFQGGVRRGL